MSVARARSVTVSCWIILCFASSLVDSRSFSCPATNFEMATCGAPARDIVERDLQQLRIRFDLSRDDRMHCQAARL
jgi:hypothetical protein